MNEQQTLATTVEFSGVGLHTGRDARVVVSAAAVDHGLRFTLAAGVEFPAHADYVVDTRRATVLGHDGQTVSTVEHLLSALVGSGIDNAQITVEGPEIPVLDGSAVPFVHAFHAAGIIDCGGTRKTLRPQPLRLEENGMWIEILPADGFSIEMSVDFRPPIGQLSFAAMIDGNVYADDIAAARTFGYLEEVEALRARGLALGGSLENAIVFGPEGPLQPLRWPNEPVRHKVLDLIGDFALVGSRLDAKIIAHKSGHALHARAVRGLREQLR